MIIDTEFGPMNIFELAMIIAIGWVLVVIITSQLK